MSPTRRQVVCAVGTGAALPTTVATASARQDDDQDEDRDDGEFSPEITFNSNNLVATIGEREGGVDPDEVVIQTADGSTHRFDGTAADDWKAGEAFEVGYTNANQQDTRARIENWHGILVKVTATRGDRTVSETNDNESSLEVSCSLWKTPDEPPTEFTALSEGASKQHINRGDQDLSADQRQYGSPGRALWTVAEENPEAAMRVDFLECEPGDEKALWFDCTSVTVTEDELNQGGERIEDVQLTFNDGTTEQPPGTADEADNGAYELPVTLSGSGDNEEKVLKKLQFRVDRGRFTYWNLEADQCSAEQDDGGDGGESTPESGDGTPESGDGSSGSDGGSGSEETATETPTEEGPSSDETGSTSTPEPTDDGSGSGSGSGDGSGSSGGSSGRSDGASDDAYRDSAQDTETSQTVDVGGGNGDASRTTSADDAGTATASPSSANGSAGAGNGTESGGAEPVTTDGVTSEDQPGMGFVSALGGLLGLGELARRRLGSEPSEAPERSEVPGDVDDDR